MYGLRNVGFVGFGESVSRIVGMGKMYEGNGI